MATSFKEILSTAIFTTKYVLDEESPILHVYHFEDGSWQFSGSEEDLGDEEYRLVSLGEILELDGSLDQLGNLEMGFEAVRDSRADKWSIIQSNSC